MNRRVRLTARLGRRRMRNWRTDSIKPTSDFGVRRVNIRERGDYVDYFVHDLDIVALPCSVRGIRSTLRTHTRLTKSANGQKHYASKQPEEQVRQGIVQSQLHCRSENAVSNKFGELPTHRNDSNTGAHEQTLNQARNSAENTFEIRDQPTQEIRAGNATDEVGGNIERWEKQIAVECLRNNDTKGEDGYRSPGRLPYCQI